MLLVVRSIDKPLRYLGINTDQRKQDVAILVKGRRIVLTHRRVALPSTGRRNSLDPERYKRPEVGS